MIETLSESKARFVLKCCAGEDQKDCLHFRGDGLECEYYVSGNCESILARVQRCVIELKASGIKNVIIEG